MMEKAKIIYKQLKSLPSLTSAKIKSREQQEGLIEITSIWSQTDFEREEEINFFKNYFITNDKPVISSYPIEINKELWNVENPSRKLRAILRQVKVKDKKVTEPKQFLEIWTRNNKIHNIDLQKLEKHGKVYNNDSCFGSFSWSPSENKILYIAEKKTPKSKPFLDNKPSKESDIKDKLPEEEATEGDEYLYKDNWGEQMTEKINPIVCILDLTTLKIILLDYLPTSISQGQAIWGPDDSSLLLVGWEHEPYKLGFIYCPMRESNLFHINLESSSWTKQGPLERSVRWPRLSRDRSKFVFLTNCVMGPHNPCSSLLMGDWSSFQYSVIVDQVNYAETEDDFPGLFTGGLPIDCWSSDNKRILLTSQWRSKTEILVINVDDKKITRLTNAATEGSWRFLSLSDDDIILALCSSPNKPYKLLYGKLPEIGKENEIKWNCIDESENIEELVYSCHSVVIPPQNINPKFDKIDYEYILYKPKEIQTINGLSPLVVYCHGGPHACYMLTYYERFAAFCLLGYTVLLVNYRGSSGFGQDGIFSLCGNVGKQDVLDIQNVVEEVVKSEKIDPHKVVISGGSHGGFLTAHLIGKYPGYYKAAIIINPVINIGALATTSDIPDWSYNTSGFSFDMANSTYLTEDIYASMLKVSPIIHADKVETPVLLMLGKVDLRCPSSQGFQYYKTLKAKNKIVRLQWYPESCHPLSEVPVDTDVFLNKVRWFAQHLKLDE